MVIAGGEGSSGGFIMPSFTYCRDALLAEYNSLLFRPKNN